MKGRRFIAICVFIAMAMLIIFQNINPTFAHHVRPPVYSQTEQKKTDGWGAAEWGTTFAGGLLLIAIGALGYAIKQVQIAHRQTEAMILLELETRWFSPRITEARETLNSIHRRVSELINQKYACKTKEETDEKIIRGVTIMIYTIRRYDSKNYRKIHSLLELFESMGVFIYVLRGLKQDSVAHLFAGAIAGVDRLTRRYILQWQKSDPGAFEHALSLFRNIEIWLRARRGDPRTR